MTKKRQSRPNNCVDCGHPLRPANQTVEQAPGTRRHNGRGLCQACYHIHKKPVDVYAGNCNTCDRPMRKQQVRIKDAPGTVQQSGNGQCHACYLRNDRVRRRTKKEARELENARRRAQYEQRKQRHQAREEARQAAAERERIRQSHPSLYTYLLGRDRRKAVKARQQRMTRL